MAKVRFQFDAERALDAISAFLELLGPLEKVKLTKLLYLADKQHFLNHGRPITGDRQCAMDYGPLPSSCLSLLNGMPILPAEIVFSCIHVDDNKVHLRLKRPVHTLSTSERSTISSVAEKFGRIEKWALSKRLHKLPEFEEVYEEGTSRTIEYERMAALSGDDNRYRHGRLIISEEAAAAVNCPYPVGDDL